MIFHRIKHRVMSHGICLPCFDTLTKGSEVIFKAFKVIKSLLNKSLWISSMVYWSNDGKRLTRLFFFSVFLFVVGFKYISFILFLFALYISLINSWSCWFSNWCCEIVAISFLLLFSFPSWTIGIDDAKITIIDCEND